MLTRPATLHLLPTLILLTGSMPGALQANTNTAAMAAATTISADVQARAQDIIRKMDILMRGDTSIGAYRMTITDPDWTRTLTLNAWENRLENKSFIRILSPAREEGIVTLKIDYEMWNYLPRVERVLKVPPSMMLQPWMGSDFSNDDLVKASSVVTDYSHTVLAEEILDDYNTYKIELIPDPDAPVVWGKILAWVRQSDSMPLRQEFYAEDGELIRTLRFSNIRVVGKREIPTYWEMIPASTAGRGTVMEVLDLTLDQPIDPNIFSLRNLKLDD